jgi:diguanylate cyclase (GGDEF)-like protein/PAS domain S-box-containing protein
VKPIHVKSILIACGFVLVFSVVFLNSKSTNLQQYRQEIQLLRDIRLTNALVNQELLTIRFQMLTNFDLLTAHINKLKDKYQQLVALNNSAYNIIKTQEITNLVEQLTRKFSITNEFKTANALLKNSLMVFPNLNTDLQIKLSNFENTDSVAHHIDSLLRDIYLYSLTNDNQLESQMLSKVEKLESLQFEVAPEITPYLNVIHRHAKTVIDNRHEANRIINELLGLPIEHLTYNIQKAYMAHNENLVEQSNIYRKILFAISIILMSLTAYILFKLKRKTHELEHEKNRALVTLHSIGDGIITTDSMGTVEYLNPVAEQLTGWNNFEAQGKHLSDIFHVYDERTRTGIKTLVERCISENKNISSASQSVLINRDGSKRAIEDTVAPIRGINNEIIGATIVFRDVSRTRELSRKLSYQASHDALTNVINRRAFEIQLAKAITQAKKNSEKHALLYLDLDQFKVVNDTCGHDAGDQLLIQITSLLQSKLGINNTLARLGGDEFGILLRNCNLNKARDFAETVLTAMKQFRFEWQSIHFQLGVSIGIAMIDEKCESLVSAMSAADMACYVAKDTGRNRVHIYSHGNKELVRRKDEMQWVSKLSTALKENKFVLFKQPIVPLCRNANQENIELRYELLLRLKGKNGTIVLPNEFIPAAERYNFMPTLDRWVIGCAFSHLARSKDDNASYSINLSGTSLNSNTLLKYIKQEFRKYDISPEKICFEITETAAIKNLPKVAKLVRELKKMGFKFALDDFGKGVSSFMYLSSLPVDYLKIDGEFVRNLLNNTVNHAIIWSINNIGRILGIEIIAEYVENENLHDALIDIGIDYAQGFKFGEPEPLLAPALEYNDTSNVTPLTIA